MVTHFSLVRLCQAITQYRIPRAPDQYLNIRVVFHLYEIPSLGKWLGKN
jgi:hypothetical protein